MIKDFKFDIHDQVTCPTLHGSTVFIVKRQTYFRDSVHKVWMYLCIGAKDPEQSEAFEEDKLIRWLGI